MAACPPLPIWQGLCAFNSHPTDSHSTGAPFPTATPLSCIKPNKQMNGRHANASRSSLRTTLNFPKLEGRFDEQFPQIRSQAEVVGLNLPPQKKTLPGVKQCFSGGGAQGGVPCPQGKKWKLHTTALTDRFACA